MLVGVGCFGRLNPGNGDGTEEAETCPDKNGGDGSNEAAAALVPTALLFGEPDTLGGFSVASAGAHNTDDYGDLLVGAPGYDPEEVTRVPVDGDVVGKAYLLHGPMTTGQDLVVAANVVFTGEAVGDGAGASVVAADLNGDGYQDAVVGAPFGQLSGTQSGLAYVAYGPHAGATLLEATQRIAGESHGDWFGWRVATADMNGDDRLDLLVGAPGASDGAGAVTVGTGDGGGIVSDVHTVGAFVVEGEEYDMFGFALGTGDVDGDGIDDVVGGAPRMGDEATGAGVVYVVTGPLDDDAFAADGQVLTHGVKGDGFGRAVVLGDLDGDGNNDVLVGAPGDDATDEDAGAAYAFRGGVQMAELPFLAIVGQANGDNAGESVAVLDLDGDRVQDVAVGAPFADADGVSDVGRAYAVYGPAEGCVELGATYSSYAGGMYGDRAGKRVANVGDTNDNGTDDLVVVSPYGGLTDARSGIVYLFTGE